MRALITSGGGAKGAFTVGALSYIIKQKAIGSFEVISGTSTGALIAALVAAGKIDVLETIYTSVPNNDAILRQQNVIANLRHNKPYFFDTAPLEGMIRTHVDKSAFDTIKASSTILLLTAISLQTGRITVFSNVALDSTKRYDVRLISTHKELLDALLASSNQAAFLPPVEISTAGKQEQFVDGGNREVIPAMAVLDLLPRPGELYVLSNNPKDIVLKEGLYTNIMDVLMRAISIFIQDVRENDKASIEQYRLTHGTTVHYIEPTRDLDPSYPTGLRFDPILMGIMMAEGEREAERVLGPPIGRTRHFAPEHFEGEVARDATSRQCRALTIAGARCKNNTNHANRLCHIHRDLA